MNRIIKGTFELYIITLIIPFVMTIMVVFAIVMGITYEHGYLMKIKDLWVGFYYDGIFMGVIAWRWQLGLLLLSFIFFLSSSDEMIY